MFCNQRIAIPGKLIQDRQIFMGPTFPKATQTFRTNRALLMRLTGELRKRARKSASVRTASCRNVKVLELGVGRLKLGLTRLLSKTIPWADFEAIVTSVNSITYGRVEIRAESGLYSQS